MRIFCLILFCVFYQDLTAQNSPVFQVLYAEKATLNNGTPLKSLDKLLDETIHVADSGYLVLIHETGIPVELNGDTTIALSEVHTILNPPSKDKHLSTYQRSIGVEYLLIPQGVEARKFRLNRTGAYFNDALVHSVYAPLINGYVYFDDDVKVVWKRGFVGINLDVSVVNVFDEKLKSPIIDDSTVLINKQELIDQKTDCIITFATVTEKGKKKKKNYTRGIFHQTFLHRQN